MLGLAVGEKSILVAEVLSIAAPAASKSDAKPAPAAAGPAFQATRFATYVYPEGVTLAQSELIGQGLALFLRNNDFTARQAVLGLPAKWVVAKAKEVPPASPAIIAESLRLQAEGDFSQSFSDLVYDYAGETSDSEPRSVLLTATPKKYVDQVMEIAVAARLEPVSVTPSAASLGWATSRESKDALVLSLGAGGAEFTAHRDASPTLLRHLGPVPASPGPMFLSELRRTALLVGGSDGRPRGVVPLSAGAGGNGSLSKGRRGPAGASWSSGTASAPTTPPGGPWGNQSACRSAWGTLRRWACGPGSRKTERRPPRRNRATPARMPRRCRWRWPGSRSGRSRGAHRAIPIDFLHSRLAPPKKTGIDRRVLWGAIIGTVVVLLAIIFYVDTQRLQSDLDAKKALYNSQKKNIESAEAFVARTSYAAKWHAAQPNFVACLSDLTRAVPDDRQMYVTSFTLRNDLKGSVIGKSTSERGATALLDALRGTGPANDKFVGKFTAVNIAMDARDTGRNGREVSFTISFKYVPPDK